MAVKMICLDIDGTLLNSRKNLTEETKAAVRFARSRGVRVFLASGRSYPGLQELMEELGVAGDCICMNGTLIYAGGKEIYRNSLDSGLIHSIISCAEKYGSQLFLAGVDFNLTNQAVDGQVRDVVQNGSLRGDYIICTDPEEFRREAESRGGEIMKAAFKEMEEENIAHLRQDLEDLHLFQIAKSDTCFVDVNPLGATKGKGVEIAARYLGIPMSDVLCIGDNENDREMIEAAGIGVAMGNADPGVKRVACYVTGTNDEDGAASAIRLFLEEQYVVTEHGVLPDVEELQTEAIQRLADLCRDRGGGEILFPRGEYHIGSIRLYSNTILRLMEGASLVGSRDRQDYQDENGEEHFRGPMGIIFSNCEKIRLEGYTFVNSANWSHQMDSCRDISVKNVTVLAGHDGLDLHHCTDIRVDRCRFETGDDCFAGYDVEMLHVRNCYMNTACNALRLGGYDITFEECIFEGPGHYPHISEGSYDTHALFKYYAIRPDKIRRDGGKILIRNCRVSNVRTLFSYDYGREDLMQNNRPLRDLTLENVEISGVKQPSCFRGNREPCLLTLRNVQLRGGDIRDLIRADESVVLCVEKTNIQEKEYARDHFKI